MGGAVGRSPKVDQLLDGGSTPAGEHGDSTVVRMPVVAVRMFAADTGRLAAITQQVTPVLRERADGRFDVVDGAVRRA